MASDSGPNNDCNFNNLNIIEKNLDKLIEQIKQKYDIRIHKSASIQITFMYNNLIEQ